jgi:hypothetical protein
MSNTRRSAFSWPRAGIEFGSTWPPDGMPIRALRRYQLDPGFGIASMTEGRWRRSPLVWIRHRPRLPMEPQFASHVTWTPTPSFSSVISARLERRCRSPRSAELLQPEGAHTPLAVEAEPRTIALDASSATWSGWTYPRNRARAPYTH